MAAKTFYLDTSYAKNFDRSQLKFSTLDTYNQWGCISGLIAVLFFGGGGLLLLIVALLLLLFPVPDVPNTPPAEGLSQSLLIMLAVGAGSIFISTFFLRMMLKTARGQSAFRKLKESGVLLDGAVVSSKATWRGRYSRYLFAEITYSFTTPDGRPLTRSLAGYRPDLKNNLPQPGTPVRVLYAGDSAVTIL